MNLQRPATRWTIAIPFAAHRRHDRPPRYDSEPHAESTVETYTRVHLKGIPRLIAGPQERWLPLPKHWAVGDVNEATIAAFC